MDSRHLAIIIGVALPATLSAQCPDGTPPPCRGAQIASARRTNPPLDDKTWIVVPFANLTRNQDLEWLRAASVNLLYLDLSQWREIHVVDDERVADLIKEVSPPQANAPLSLNIGLAIARRAGAGKLVMGDLLKVGSKTGVVAKVFDVKGGQRLRSVREETTSPDSVMPLFNKLARGILNLPQPSGEASDIGTKSIEAYREYVAGVQSLNAFDLGEAHRHFERSLQIDSTFALPHYKLSIVIGWENPSDLARRSHADAAARLSSGLPARERALISGQRKFSLGEYSAACDDYNALVRADSSDVEALYGLGECTFHDDVIEHPAGDTTQWRFHGSWNTAARAFRRVLVLDPGNYLAFQHILDLLGAETRSGCVKASAEPCSGHALDYIAAVQRSADTIVTVPGHAALDAAAHVARMEERGRTKVRVRNFDEARVLAEEWVSLAPRGSTAHASLAHVYVLLGRLDDAERQLALVQAGGVSPLAEFQILLDRLEIAIRRGNGTRAIAILDSAALVFRGKPTPGNVTVSLALANTIVGRFAGLDSVLDGFGAMLPPLIVRYYKSGMRAIIAGERRDSINALELQIQDLLTPGVGAVRTTALLGPTMTMGLRFKRAKWPTVTIDPNDKSVTQVILRASKALSEHDTAAFRRVVLEIDSVVASPGSGMTRTIAAFTSAESHLILHDSSGALRQLRRLLDTTYVDVPITSTLTAGFDAPGIAYPRAALERANLAAALGFKDEAREWYRRYLDLWSRADAEFAPLLAEVRKRYASLGA